MFFGGTSLAAVMLGAAPASADALLLLEAESGKVLHAENAAYPWYPASLTKLMTLYVTLQAIDEGRFTPDTLVTVSAKAATQAPAKMGFQAGSKVTIDNALKMLMVKSANDMAVTLAEGVSGSVEAFSDEMNATAQRLGMVQSIFVNPNGLPADNQISSARDLGILARALIHDFPEYEFYWHLPGIKYGKRVTRNYNKLLGRYPGADGMKTGYICASGFNLVATATRNGKQLIAVVLGAPSSSARAAKATQLLERGFNGGGLAWLTPSLGTVNALTPIAAAPPNLREEMCGGHRRRPAAENEDDSEDVVVSNGESSRPSVMLSALQAPMGKSLTLADLPRGDTEPVEVYAGPPKKPSRAELIAIAKANRTVGAPKAVALKPAPIVTGSTGPAAKVTVTDAARWTSLTPTPMATVAPMSMAAVVPETPAAVPLPRARPKIKTQKR
ncbi:MAG: serine hydrolase [Xanthobacteraceae bacterium]